MQFEIQEPQTIPFYVGDKKLGEAVKIDIASFFSWFIRNYPGSRKTMCENLDYQFRFR